MQKNRRFPKLHIRSKNELAKHISHKGFSKEDSLDLINDVVENFEQYWKDSSKSNPEKKKYIRSAWGTRLGRLLREIDAMVLAPHDKLVPEFIFGGISERNHVKAARQLIGTKRRRIILKIDLQRFFEQIKIEQVINFFLDKCECTEKAARLLGKLCCVPLGPKNSREEQMAIARGFSTSPRLAVWCNLDTFIKLERLIRKKLKGKDPRIAIYVDDIGITASRASRDEMLALEEDVKKFLVGSGLVTNEEKTKIISHEEGIEFVGIRINRNTLSTSAKAKTKKDKVTSELKKTISVEDRASLKRKQKGMISYKKYVENS